MKQGSLTLIHSHAPIWPSGVRVPKPRSLNVMPRNPECRASTLAKESSRRQSLTSVSTILRRMNAEVDMRSDLNKTKCLEKLVLLSLLLVWMLFALL